MTVDEWVDSYTKKFSKAGIETARLDCLLLLQKVSKKDKNWLLTHEDKVLTEQALELLEKLAKRRIKREPLAYILGSKEFYGFSFKVDKSVLVPRPESEVTVTYISNDADDGLDLLDMGTGSGNLAVSIKLMRPDLNVFASDISKSAIKIAKENASNNKTKIEFIESDLFENINQQFDVIVANLPYVADYAKLEPELDHEPETALFAKDDGLEIYDRFFESVEKYLRDRSIIVVEHDPHQFDRILFFTDRKAHRISNFVTALVS